MLNYGHKKVSKGLENTIVSNIVLSKEDIKKNSILYVCSIPTIDNTITSLKGYFDKIKGLKASIGIFSKEGKAIIKYNISQKNLDIDFENAEGIDYTPLLAGKSFKEITGINHDRDYFLGLDFLSDMTENTKKDAVFILKYI